MHISNVQVNCKKKKTGVSIFQKNVSDVDAVIAGQSVEPNTEYIVSVTPKTSQGKYFPLNFM